MQRIQLHSGGRYPVLRSLAIIYLIMAGLAVIGGVLAAAWAMVSAPWDFANRMVLAVLSLCGAFFLVVGMLAIAEVLKLFIDMEHNTRIAALGAMPTDDAEARRPESPVTVRDVSSGHINRLNALDDETAETAEAALLRGH